MLRHRTTKNKEQNWSLSGCYLIFEAWAVCKHLFGHKQCRLWWRGRITSKRRGDSRYMVISSQGGRSTLNTSRVPQALIMTQAHIASTAPINTPGLPQGI